MNPTTAPVRAFIGLGSNLRDPQAQLRFALQRLAQLPDSQLVRASRLYRTPPWGRTDQPEFVNAVAAIDTRLEPSRLLRELQSIERDAGRERVERWGPRVLDLDILLYGDIQSLQTELTLPHSQLAQRAFVLLPLAEIAPELQIPGRGPVAALLEALDCSGIVPL